MILYLRMAIGLPITINNIEYQYPYTFEIIGIADIDKDNQIIISDVILILRMAIGLPI